MQIAVTFKESLSLMHMIEAIAKDMIVRKYVLSMPALMHSHVASTCRNANMIISQWISSAFFIVHSQLKMTVSATFLKYAAFSGSRPQSAGVPLNVCPVIMM